MIADRLGLLGRSALVLLTALLLQVAVMADLPVFDAVGDLMLVLVIGAGLVGGPDRGATIGFAAGLVYDLLLDTPFGLSALTYVVAGFAAGWVASPTVPLRWWVQVGASVVIAMAAVIFSVLVARVLGLAFALDDVVRMVLVEGIWAGLLILPARRLLQWMLGEQDPSRYRVAMP